MVSSSWDEKNAAETVLAHELGHVIASIFQEPSHNPALKMLAQILGEQVLVPTEKRAWQLGEAIYPELSQAQKNQAIQSYENGGIERASVART
jgi:hypothetical protein